MLQSFINVGICHNYYKHMLLSIITELVFVLPTIIYFTHILLYFEIKCSFFYKIKTSCKKF